MFCTPWSVQVETVCASITPKGPQAERGEKDFFETAAMRTVNRLGAALWAMPSLGNHAAIELTKTITLRNTVFSVADVYLSFSTCQPRARYRRLMARLPSFVRATEHVDDGCVIYSPFASACSSHP